jgi:hypothetical protein
VAVPARTITAPSQKFDLADHLLGSQQVVDQHQTLNDLSYWRMLGRVHDSRVHPSSSGQTQEIVVLCKDDPSLGERKRQMFLIGRAELIRFRDARDVYTSLA